MSDTTIMEDLLGKKIWGKVIRGNITQKEIQDTINVLSLGGKISVKKKLSKGILEISQEMSGMLLSAIENTTSLPTFSNEAQRTINSKSFSIIYKNVEERTGTLRLLDTTESSWKKLDETGRLEREKKFANKYGSLRLLASSYVGPFEFLRKNAHTIERKPKEGAHILRYQKCANIFKHRLYNLVGEQLFNESAVRSLIDKGAIHLDQLPTDIEIKSRTDEIENRRKFFKTNFIHIINQDGQMKPSRLLPGMYDSKDCRCYDIGRYIVFWVRMKNHICGCKINEDEVIFFEWCCTLSTPS